MKFILFVNGSDYNGFAVLFQQRDGSYAPFATCETMAAAQALLSAMNFAEKHLSEKKDKK